MASETAGQTDSGVRHGRSDRTASRVSKFKSKSQASPKPFQFLLVRRICRADPVVTLAAPDNIRGIEPCLVSRGAFDSAELREKTKITKPSGISQNSIFSEHKHRITRWNAHPLGRFPCRYEPPEPYRVNMIGASRLGWCLRLVHLLFLAVWSHALTRAPLKAFISLVEYHRPQGWRCLSSAALSALLSLWC